MPKPNSHDSIVPWRESPGDEVCDSRHYLRLLADAFCHQTLLHEVLCDAESMLGRCDDWLRYYEAIHPEVTERHDSGAPIVPGEKTHGSANAAAE